VYHTGPFLDYFVKSQFLLRVPLALARCIIYERRIPTIKIKIMPCNSELRKFTAFKMYRRDNFLFRMYLTWGELYGSILEFL